MSGRLSRFVRFERRVRAPRARPTVPTLLLSRSGAFVLSAAAHAALGQPRRVTLYFDLTDRVIGLTAADNKDAGAFRVSKQGVLNARRFARHHAIPADGRRLPVEVVDAVLFVALTGDERS